MGSITWLRLNPNSKPCSTIFSTDKAWAGPSRAFLKLWLSRKLPSGADASFTKRIWWCRRRRCSASRSKLRRPRPARRLRRGPTPKCRTRFRPTRRFRNRSRSRRSRTCWRTPPRSSCAGWVLRLSFLTLATTIGLGVSVVPYLLLDPVTPGSNHDCRGFIRKKMLMLLN